MGSESNLTKQEVALMKVHSFAQEGFLARSAYKFIAILISSFIVAILITIATIYIMGKSFSELGTGEMWLLLVLYYVIAMAVAGLFLFYLKFAVRRGVQVP